MSTAEFQLPLFDDVAKPPVREVPSKEVLRTRAYSLATWLSNELKVAVRLSITDNRSTMVSFRRGPKALILRLHHMFLEAPVDVHRALAAYAGRGQKSAGNVLDEFIRLQQPLIRKERRLNSELVSLGRCFDLKEIFDRINQAQFSGGIQANIGWGRMPQKRRRHSIRLGVYDHQLKEIRIHPLLDRPEIPKFFVEFIVFHEMLHQLFPSEAPGERKVHHSKSFRAREKQFPLYEAAILWEKANLKMLLRG